MTHITNTNTNAGRPSHGRRMIAFGAGIVATLAAGFVLAATNASADSVDGGSTFVPITPCRLFDTRPAPDNVGERSTPLGADETMIQQVTGENGDCDIPLDATAVALNATAVGATAPSFGTFFPADAAMPMSSNLNYGPGQAATPNKVDVKLSIDGKVAIFNKFGTVDMIGDITGYYTNAGLVELRQQIDQLADLVAQKQELLPQPRSYSVDSTGTSNVPADPATVAELIVTPDADGLLIVNSSVLTSSLDADGTTRCGISINGELESEFLQIWQAGGGAGPYVGQLSGTRGVPIEQGVETTIRLLCERQGTAIVNIANAQLTGVFTAQKIQGSKAPDV